MLPLHNLSQQSNPIELPEIVALIASHLQRCDLTACIRVSKDWNQAFVSFIWETIFFDNPLDPNPIRLTDIQDTVPSENFSYHTGQRIPELVISRHAHYIKSLSVFGNPTSNLVQIHFPCIKLLSLSNTWQSQSENFPPEITQIVSKCPAIENLQLTEVYIDDSKGFWESVSKATMLKSLQLSCVNVPPDGAVGFWKTFCHLEHFSVYSSALPIPPLPIPPLPHSFSFSPHKMRNLSLNSVKILSPIQQLHLITQCKGLEYLSWTEYNSMQDLSSMFSKTFPSRAWPSLHRLALTKIRLSDEDLQLILGTITGLTELKPVEAEWSIDGFRTLSRHFITLKALEVNTNPTFSSVMVNTILCSCPNLITLSARMIGGVDIINNNRTDNYKWSSQRWACTKLRNLTVHFDLQGLDSQTLILERIASLTQLESLDISNCELINRQSNCTDWSRHIQISLGKGLDILRPLKYLRELRFNDLRQEIGKSEVEWFARYWKNLYSIFGEVHYDENKCRDTRQMLKKKKIEGY